MNFNEASLGRKRDIKFSLGVFKCNLNLCRVTVPCRASADDRIPGVFIIRINGVSSPQWHTLKPIFALVICFGVRKHTSKRNAQGLCCKTQPFGWLSVLPDHNSVDRTFERGLLIYLCRSDSQKKQAREDELRLHNSAILARSR